MRLYESLSYLNNNNHNNNNNNNNNFNHTNDNIDRMSNSSLNSNGFTVKTFTSNGNQQSNIDSDPVLASSTTKTIDLSVNEESSSIGRDELNFKRNWQLDTTDFNKTPSPLNETYCFYGSHRKLKLRENLDTEDSDKANGNDANSIVPISKDTIDLIDDSSSDIEAEINRLINRSNLCRQQFECAVKVAPTSEEQFMDEEGNGFFLYFFTSNEIFFICFLQMVLCFINYPCQFQRNFHHYRYLHH